ncbi:MULTISPECIES: hypothetical protein [Haloarcula]|uniref:hypothetical protein n=1 Tax=Haloarcula TaxID=2237 RepID=UPI0023E8C81D|nr:hypothetical protein [Halomicroarcula sp. SHR3]
MALSVDDARLSDLSVGGWLGVGLAVLGIGIVATSAGEWLLSGADPIAGLVGGGFVALIGAALAHDNATPDEEGTCEHCGAHVRVHSSRDTADEAVLVRMSGRPRRISLGPVSVVAQRQTTEHLYCSGECASEDTRAVITSDDHQATAATAEVSQRVE